MCSTPAGPLGPLPLGSWVIEVGTTWFKQHDFKAIHYSIEYHLASWGENRLVSWGSWENLRWNKLWCPMPMIVCIYICAYYIYIYIHMYVCMYVCMDGWMDGMGWDGWMDGWMDWLMCIYIYICVRACLCVTQIFMIIAPLTLTRWQNLKTNKHNIYNLVNIQDIYCIYPVYGGTIHECLTLFIIFGDFGVQPHMMTTTDCGYIGCTF